jgi:CYTH domain-containing protein
MAIEVERKFLVADASCLEGVDGVRIAQGYLSLDPDRTVRVRLAGDEAWITIKGRTDGLSRAEFEFPIPAGEASDLLNMCAQPVIDKTRHRLTVGEHVWEVDVFHGDNEGLLLAEVELRDESDEPLVPPWIGREVSDDPRFFNANLATRPFRSFGDTL